MNTSSIDKEATKYEYSEIFHVSITTNLEILSFAQIFFRANAFMDGSQEQLYCSDPGFELF